MDERQVFDALRLAASASQADEAWAELDALPRAARRGVIDAIEKVFIEEVGDIASDYAPVWERMQGKDIEFPNDAEAARMVDHYQGIAQTFLHIRDEKGDQAHPMTQDYAYRAFQLSAYDYNTLKGQIGLMVEVYNEYSMPKEEPKPQTLLAKDFPLSAANKTPPKAITAGPPKPVPKKGPRKFEI